MRLRFTASKALSALLGLTAYSSPLLARSSSGPDEMAAGVMEWLSNFQQDLQASRAEAPQAIPPADATGPSVSLDQLADAAGIERTLRELVDGKGPLRLTVPNGRAWMGDFGLGTGDTLRGNLLVLRGTAEIFGRLEGNVVALDGDIVVHRGGSVSGDALALSGRVRDADRAIEGEVRSLSSVAEPARRSSSGITVFRRGAGLLGVFLILSAIGVGLVTFARPTIETVSDTVRHSLGRAFVTGLVAQMLVIPTFGMLIVGLALTVVGVLLIPFAVAAYVLLFLAAVVLGILAMSHAMGETYTRRRMALGVLVSPNSYRYVGLGLTALLALWAVWALFGWVPVAGTLVLGGAAAVTWVLGTVGFGASLLSRAGIRPDFAGRLVPPEALTDEYLWATPQMGVPAVRRPNTSALTMMVPVEVGRSGSKRVEERSTLFDVLRLSSTLFVIVPAAHGQTMRDYTASRPYRGEQRMTVALDFAAGELRLMPAAPGTLYRMESRYDSERYGPRSEYHVPTRELAIGLKSEGKGGIRVTNSKQLEQQATVWLSPEVELGLALSLGASESRIDLGGLRLRDLRLEVGGSRTRLSFSRPGVGSCREAVVEVGAGELEVDRFANSGCSRLRLNGGVGLVSLDLGGQPEAGIAAEVTMTMGRLTLKLPKGAGVRLTLDRFFASFSPAGFSRQGEQFVTPDYASARRKIDLRVASSVGAVKVEWY